MGITYLMYSAYFLSNDVDGMSSVINFFLSVLYLVLGITNILSLKKILRILRTFLVNNDAEIP